MNYKEEIRKLISSGKVEKAISKLLNEIDLSVNQQKEVELISARFQRWKKEFSLGLSDDKTELSQIEYSLLNFLQQKKEPPLDYIKTSQSKTKKLKYFFVLLIIPIVYLIIHFNLRNINNVELPKEKNVTETSLTKEDRINYPLNRRDDHLDGITEPEILDFNSSLKNSVKVIFQSELWNKKDTIYIPNNMSASSLRDALVDNYKIREVSKKGERGCCHVAGYLLKINHETYSLSNDIYDKRINEIGLKENDLLEIEFVFICCNNGSFRHTAR